VAVETAPLPSPGGFAVPGVVIQVGRRLLGAFLVIFGVVTLTFLLTRVFTADPSDLLSPPNASAADRAAVRVRLGLNDPLPVQYLRYLGDLVHGNLGTSYLTGRPVTADLMTRLPATAELATYALVLGILGGVTAGVLAAVFQGSLFDRLLRLVTSAGLALPQFWVALMLLWVFFVKFNVLPGPTGRLPIGMDPPPTITGFYLVDSVLSGDLADFWPALAQLCLPVFALSCGVWSPLARGARSAMILALKADYVRTARALGLSRRRTWFVYALRNALLPVITMLAGTVAWAFSGSVLLEGAFGWPGAGHYALSALEGSDFPAVQGFVLYAAILYVIVYQLLDLAYSLADPRIRS
jgi:ABC-type dipeptide/oligopeptide/nickel transport system permease component